MVKINTEVSVIVPVYNGGKHIVQCVESLLHQSFEDIEIIVINDGSTDESKLICERYMLKDDRIKVINQKNEGVSAARNRGIKNAQGKYLLFSDIDDYYEEDAIEKLYRSAIANDADWVVGAVRKEIYHKIEVAAIGNEVCHTEEQRQNIIARMTKNYLLYQLWGKLYRTSIIKENNLYMREEMFCGEDVEWICRFVTRTSTIACISDIVYNYIIQNQKSLSQKFNPDYFFNIEKQYVSLKDLYQKENMWETHGFIVMRQQAQSIVSGYAKIGKKECGLSIQKRINFVKTGISLKSTKECRSSPINLVSGYKKMILNMKSAVGIVLLMVIAGGVYKISKY